VQLALKLDGSTLEGRKVRIKRSVKKEKKATGAKTAAMVPRRGGGAKDQQATGKAANAEAFRRRVARKTQPAGGVAFRGETADGKKKKKKKQKKFQTKKTKKIHFE